MKARRIQWVGLVIALLVASAAPAQIPIHAIQGMMRSTVRPTGAVAPPAYEFTWATAETTRNWTGAALSTDGRRQTAVVQWGLIYVSTNYGVAWSAKESARRGSAFLPFTRISKLFRTAHEGTKKRHFFSSLT